MFNLFACGVEMSLSSLEVDLWLPEDFEFASFVS
jgi:hypothetical protein